MDPICSDVSGGTAVAAALAGESASPLVWLCLLGGFRPITRGEPVSVRSGGKTEALLVHLGLASWRGISREALLHAIWPDSDPLLAAQALNGVLRGLRTLLRAALGGAEPVVPSVGHYRLNEAAGVAVVVAQFRELVATGDALHADHQPILAVDFVAHQTPQFPRP
jgi:DNA-binding SARP family transcriptional activator